MLSSRKLIPKLKRNSDFFKLPQCENDYFKQFTSDLNSYIDSALSGSWPGQGVMHKKTFHSSQKSLFETADHSHWQH